jgi:drug/metabolite transporter (DMT)-like permease
MKNLSPRLRGTLEISIASMGFGFLGIFGKWAFSSGLSVGEFLSYRFALAGILLWIALLLFKPDWVKLTKKQIEKLMTTMLNAHNTRLCSLAG